MKIFYVEGTLVATARIGGLELHRLLVVVDRKGSKQVAVDPVGCKPGDWVIACGSSAAREAAGHKEPGSTEPGTGAPRGARALGRGVGHPVSERAVPERRRPTMNIQRVVGDLVATSRVPTLQNRSLRVVEDESGDLEVALDPVGTRPGDFVITISTSAARHAAGDYRITTDLTIGGIIDHWSEDRWRD